MPLGGCSRRLLPGYYPGCCVLRVTNVLLLLHVLLAPTPTPVLDPGAPLCSQCAFLVLFT